jgi:putative SOS response-associated peptidase YedK
MCGRFSLLAIGEVLSSRFNIEINEPIQPRYNIAPGQDTIVILNESPDNITKARWGLVPSWAKDEKIGLKMINARAETLKEKPAYKGPFYKQRCLVLADSFYEWKKTPTGKIPYRISMKDEQPFALAGIYDKWDNIISFSIVTLEPNDIVKPVHDRMPAILKREHEQLWLKHPYEKLLYSYPSEEMKSYQISTLINSPANDNPDVIKPHQSTSLLDFA